MRLYVVGGGGCIIRNFYEYDEKRVVFITDICAVAKGYEDIAFTALRKEMFRVG
jgi:plasmid segregation protein ParM